MRTACLVLMIGVAAAACQQRASPSTGIAAPGSGAAAPASTTSAGAAAVKVRQDNPCSVLLPQEAESILGVSITMREVVDEVTCSFPFDATPKKPAGGAAPSSVQPPANSRDAEAAAKALASSLVGDSKPQLVVKVYFKDGRATITAQRLAASMLGSFEQLPGIGDEAWLGPMASTLVFRKGDVGVELDLQTVPDARDKGIRLAKLIASRL